MSGIEGHGCEIDDLIATMKDDRDGMTEER